MQELVDPFALLKECGSSITPLRWTSGILYLLDQRLLPDEEKWLAFSSAHETAEAIRDMVVRGAPAIGITAAFGLALEARRLVHKSRAEFLESWLAAACMMLKARPTAVNLRWAVERLKRLVIADSSGQPDDIAKAVEREALAIWAADIAANIAMGRFGAALLPDKCRVLTHCNAGALATGGYGTALGVIRAAVRAGKNIEVLADETRPWLQGARLTAWELLKDNIPVTLIADSAAGFFMRRGLVDAIIVGADRIAANGDVANKIGTYTLSELAKANGVPFYVVAPCSTIDLETPSGSAIPIEERDGMELLNIGQVRIAAQGASVRNPVFDVTPCDLISSIVTEHGALFPPYDAAIKMLLSDAKGIRSI
ncbi:MAG: S-methyl-5-thioribose-1-phosphate isomerase [Dissulfurimicrobium sp.]|uniref:S-methyl-5-thioribose-1-phosphate isomerase n=1 Tax=Dissulfurimicrobium sp. TaxID=2022436 RepID=UPI004049714F